jgi:hypothetical protein
MLAICASRTALGFRRCPNAAASRDQRSIALFCCSAWVVTDCKSACWKASCVSTWSCAFWTRSVVFWFSRVRRLVKAARAAASALALLRLRATERARCASPMLPWMVSRSCSSPVRVLWSVCKVGRGHVGVGHQEPARATAADGELASLQLASAASGDVG